MDDWLEVEGGSKNSMLLLVSRVEYFLDRCLCHFKFRVFAMKRNKITKSNNQGKQIEHKRRIAFHEAGHATAIHLNNKARNLPPIFFRLCLRI